MTGSDDLVTVGKVTGLYGVRGWIKVYSETDPPEKIFDYRPWQLGGTSGTQRTAGSFEGRVHGKRLLARVEGCDDREVAATLVGAEIRVARALFGELADGEYYWADLVGLEVVTTTGLSLGRIDRLFATGANDVIVVRGDRERLVPYTPGNAVVDVDLAGQRMTVAWDPDF